MISDNTPSAHVIGANDDLLIEILLLLPTKSLFRFKSVSKRFLSLITHPHFHHRRSRILTAVSGIFLHRYTGSINPDHDFVPLREENPPKPPFRTLNFADDPHGIRILNSCNGLLCCSSFRGFNCKCNYYIYNPTTNRFAALPNPRGKSFRFSRGAESVCSVHIAFDPLKSAHYKVVCVYPSDLPEFYELEVYSSETGEWKRPCYPFLANVNFKGGAFWNGAVNWVGVFCHSLYFNVDQEILRSMPSPPLPENSAVVRRVEYFGQSGDHLLSIRTDRYHMTQFDVYEMQRDYSGWVLKFRVDLEAAMNASPEMISSRLNARGMNYYGFYVIGIVCGESDGESFLVLSLPGMAVRCNIGGRSFVKICDFAPGGSGQDGEGRHISYKWYEAFQYIESVVCV